jgi:molybdate transport system substrate-binding protein
MKHFSLTVFVAALVLATGALHAAEVTVFAAASLTDALKQIAADYEKSTGDKVVFNFAASGPLARQIEAGAPVDIFISADEARCDALAAKGLLLNDSRRNLLGNTLVIVTPPEDTTIHGPADLTNAAVKRVALGDLKSVPVGTYAREYFQRQGLWTGVEPKSIPCESVRAVLATVETGNVDAGVVYKTDARISKKVKVAYEVPAADGPKITYPAALVTGAPQLEAAKKFFAYLASPDAGKVFQGYGFIVLGE